MSEELKKIAHELRAYNPTADQGKGKYVHEYWAKRIEALIDPAPHPLIQTLHNNGDLIAAQATITHQAKMIEHLRGGLTTPTTTDVANADADGFKNGFATAIRSLPEQQYFINWASYTEWRAAQIEALGDYGAEVKP